MYILNFNIYDFTSFTAGINDWLAANFSPFWTVAIEMLLIGLVILLFYALVGLYLVHSCNVVLDRTVLARTAFSKPLPTLSSC